MLVLQQPKQQPEKCSLNILPCRINYNGPSKVTKRFWSPTSEKDGSKTAYFRGRKLRSRIVKVPARYQGIVAMSTERTLPEKPSTLRRVEPDDSDLEELDQEEASEPVKILESAAAFDEVTIWGHDQVPAADEPFVKGVEEWISFADAIHNQPAAAKPSESRSSS